MHLGVMTWFSCHSGAISFSQWHKNNIGGKYGRMKQLVKVPILRPLCGLSCEQALLVSQASPSLLYAVISDASPHKIPTWLLKFDGKQSHKATL